MDKALLDTDILSEISRGKNAIVTEKAASYRSQFGQFTSLHSDRDGGGQGTS
jgi:hypothetical protein